ncbi:MAG: zf-HC2 domain-containing protein [Acidobacteriota bacterium]|nr:zf-HC2 domain-containing protein [Acidobacteriota bacterium]
MDSHPTDDQLELYALRRLTGPENEAIEEHLLLCDPCRSSCEEVADFAIAMREALKTAPMKAESRWFGWLRPNLALAGAFAALLVAVALYWTTGSGRLATIATLQLTAMRGSEIASVQPARELDITLTDAAGASRIEIVATDGAPVWSGPYSTTIVVNKALPQGQYLLRAYRASGQMLHEYAFRIEKQK